MSRLAKKPIKLPQGVTCEVKNDFIIVKGTKGELRISVNPFVKVELKDNSIILNVVDPEDKKTKAHWGLIASLIMNMITGVTEGYEKKLEINGVGHKAQMKGKDLELHVGFSHPVDFKVPVDIVVNVEKNVITVSGIDKQRVGQVAAEIRDVKKPEPYKGKGIKYLDEVIRRKAGKVGKAAA